MSFEEQVIPKDRYAITISKLNEGFLIYHHSNIFYKLKNNKLIQIFHISYDML